jgi:hypothetical protein
MIAVQAKQMVQSCGSDCRLTGITGEKRAPEVFGPYLCNSVQRRGARERETQ